MTNLKEAAAFTEGLKKEFFEQLIEQYESSRNKNYYVSMAVRRLATLAYSNAENSNPNVRLLGEMEMSALGEFILKYGEV